MIRLLKGMGWEVNSIIIRHIEPMGALQLSAIDNHCHSLNEIPQLLESRHVTTCPHSSLVPAKENP